ncbi:MAG: O-Antigen ligase [Syntrophorhabdus sp. PtaB.Bin006]|nr:MAG: O-Antigen ligase [Syntrophorhabdus sp. PtaB.Bin006]
MSSSGINEYGAYLNRSVSFLRYYHIAALLLGVSLLTFGRHDPFMYLTWAVCGIVAYVVLSFVSISMKVGRLYLGVLIAMTAWMWYAIVITPFVVHKDVHINVVIMSFAYSLATVGLLAWLTKEISRFIRMIGMIIVAWVVAGFCYFVLFHMGVISYEERDFSAMYYNRNTLAVVGCFLLCIWLSFLPELRKSYPMGIGSIVIPALCILLIFSTFSTKGFIGVIIVLFAYGLRLYQGKRRALMLSVFLAVAVLTFTIAGGGALERVHKKWEGVATVVDSQFEDTTGRLFLIIDSLRIIKKSPLMGVGVYNSQYHLFTPRYWILLQRGQLDSSEVGVGVYSHVNYLEMFLNGGVPAFLLYYLPLFLLFWRIVKARQVTPFGARIRYMLISLLSLKLFFDIGMVSFESFIHIFVVATCFVFYGKFLCQKIA